MPYGRVVGKRLNGILILFFFSFYKGVLLILKDRE